MVTPQSATMLAPGFYLMEKLHLHGLGAVLIGALLTIIAYIAFFNFVFWIILRLYKRVYGVTIQQSIGTKLKFRRVLGALSNYVMRDVLVIILYAVGSMFLMYSSLVRDPFDVKIYMVMNTLMFTFVSVVINKYLTKADLSLLENDRYGFAAAVIVYAGLLLVFDVVLKLGSGERPSLIKGRWEGVLIFITPSVGGAIASVLWKRVANGKKRSEISE